MEVTNAVAIGLIIVVVILSLLALAMLLASVVFWAWMLVDCLQRDKNKFPNRQSSDKVFWSLLIFSTYMIGAVLYYFIVKTKIK